MAQILLVRHNFNGLTGFSKDSLCNRPTNTLRQMFCADCSCAARRCKSFTSKYSPRSCPTGALTRHGLEAEVRGTP
jgi:hypothetical protein